MTSIKRTIGAVGLTGALFFAGFGCSSSGSTASFCKNAKTADAKNFSPTDGKKFNDMLDKLESSAPSEIKGDIKTLADAMTTLQKDPSKVKDLDQAKLKKASDNIEKYLKDKCGIQTSS